MVSGCKSLRDWNAALASIGLVWATADASLLLDDAIRLSLSHSHEVQRAQKGVSTAQAQALEAGRNLLPSVQAKLGWLGGTVPAGPFQGRSYGFDFEEAVPIGAKGWAEVTRTRLGVAIAQANLEEVRLKFLLRLADAYWSLWLAEEEHRAFENLLLESEKVRDLVKREAGAGVISPLETSHALSICDQIQFESLAVEESVQLAQVELQYVLGFEPWQEVHVRGDGLLPRLDATLPEVLACAFSARPEWKLARLVEKQSQAARSAARWEALPTVTLLGSVGRGGERLSPDEPDLDREWGIGFRVAGQWAGSSVTYERRRDRRAVLLSEPRSLSASSHQIRFGILDRLDFFTHLAQSEEAVLESKVDLDQVRHTITADVETAYFECKKALLAWEGAKSLLAYRQTDLAYVRELFERDRAGPWDLLEALREFERAQGAQRQALAKAQEAHQKLEWMTQGT